jgi:hypothetical protein
MPTAVRNTGADSPARPPMIGPLGERDLPEAERIFRLAFGVSSTSSSLWVPGWFTFEFLNDIFA